MADTVEELTIDFEQDGRLVVKTVDKHVLSKGAWTTIMFLYQEIERGTEHYTPPKVSIRRYQKVHGRYMQKSKFNISSERQARLMIEALETWYKDPPVKGGEPIETTEGGG